jgi:glycerol uptake facilitator-like aquaporin
MLILRPRSLAAEALGTALLLMTVVGSGIMAERLAGGNDALALLANALATGAVLVAIILALGPISDAHFNPAVTVSAAIQAGLPWGAVPGYILAQVAGATVGVVCAHVMFDLAPLQWSLHARSGWAQMFSEAVATFGLVLVIALCSKRRASTTPAAVGLYITGAYWFTASTSFANPAVTLARTLTNTFSGIRPVDAPPFIAAQIVGALVATWMAGWLAGDATEAA